MEHHGIGLLGWGTVGGGVLDILAHDGDLLRRRCGLDLTVRAIVTRNPARQRTSDPGQARVGTDVTDILGDDQIDTVLHLVGGTDTARELALACLAAGKNLVTANKALIAEHGQELFEVAAHNRATVAFEAAVAGGIPIIAALRDGLVANRIGSIHAILNGTSNYVLTQMEHGGLTYAEALARAQELGYAEADPTLDVDGTDAAHKLAILARIAFGGPIDFPSISVEGIESIGPADMASARRLGCRIKLLAVAVARDGALELRVAPTLVPLKHPLAHVEDNYNAILVDAHAAGPNLMVGQGAGAAPTASAVIADLVDVVTGRYAATVGRFTFFSNRQGVRILPENEEITGSYARFQVPDRVGVLSTIAQHFADQGISIASIHQSEGAGEVELEAITHPCPGGAFFTALHGIASEGWLSGPPRTLRRML